MRCKKTGLKIADYVFHGRGKSSRAESAEEDGKFPKTKMIEVLKECEPEFFRGLNSKNFHEFFSPVEWHHTGKYLKKTDYYDLADLNCSRFWIFFELTRESKTLSKKRNFKISAETNVTREEFIEKIKSQNINFVYVHIPWTREFARVEKTKIDSDIKNHVFVMIPDLEKNTLSVFEFKENVLREYHIENVPQPYDYPEDYFIDRTIERFSLNDDRKEKNYHRFKASQSSYFRSWDDDYYYDDDDL